MKNRRDGIMPSLSGDFFPKHLIFFDTETYIIENELGEIKFPFRLGCAIYVELGDNASLKKREVYHFSEKHQFIEFVRSKERQRKAVYIFAHNMAFDLRVLDCFESFIDLKYVNEPPILNNMVFIWSLKNDKAKLIFLDTANYGVQSVGSLGEDLGYPKLDIDFNTVTDEELSVYNQRDVEIIEKFILSYITFIRSHRLGKFCITLASQAMTGFRTSFYKEDIYLHSHYGALQLERDAYFGGRTEIFRYGYVGQQDYYMLDVNSMYPHAMTNYPLPVKMIDYKENLYPEYLKEYIRDYYVIADLDLEIDENFLALRLSNKDNKFNYLHNPHALNYPELDSNRIIFPIGRFRTTVHHQDLLLLLEKGKIHKVHRIALYEKGYPFQEYVDFFYELKAKYKRETNLSWRLISKLFLNSLYGKFGQLEPHRDNVGYNTEHRFYREPFSNKREGIYAQDLTWDFKVYREYKQGETTFSNPAIAGSITSNARIFLYNLFMVAGKQNVFYTDTDSLIVNHTGYQNLQIYLSQTEIGKLDLQKQGRRLIIRGNKDYRMDNKLVHKGISRTAKKTGINQWRYVQFEGFITSWKDGNLREMRGEYRYKSRKSDYTKGIIQDDNSVIPFTLKEF